MNSSDSHGAHQRLLEMLIVSISRLARPASSQIAYLEALGTAPCADELALELDDVVEATLATGLLSERQGDLVKAIDTKLDAMSTSAREGLWSTEALVEAPEWEEVRGLARAALADLHAEPVASG